MKKLAFFLVLTLVAVQPLKATLIISLSGAKAGEAFFDPLIVANDLVNIGQSSLLATNANAGANDGAASSGDLSHDAWYTQDTTLVFNFNLNPLTGGSATGYNISSIQSIAGWAGAGFAAQDFELFITTLNNPVSTSYGTFSNISGVDNIANGNGSSQSTRTLLTDTTGTIASNVTSIAFAYKIVNSLTFGVVIREIDVIKTPTVVPEPSSGLLLLGGCGLIFALSRVRRVRAAL